MNKIARFFEEHVEKMVLIVVGLVCAWLMITRVIFSPNAVEIFDRKVSPSAVDDYVYEQAKAVQQEMRGPDVEIDPYQPRVPEFVKVMDSAIRDVGVDATTLVVQKSGGDSSAEGAYRLPNIGEVSDVAVNHIRAVAYVPTAEVTAQNPYDKAGNEPNDLDLVSVEARFDVRRLYEDFSARFFADVEEKYADPCLAKPVFAAVQLQRQRLTEDGGWSDWQDVPRPRIDHNKELFRIAEKVEDLPTGGLELQILQYGYKQTQIDLLQPQPYQFASAREEWFPPSLHEKYAEFQRKELAEQKRKEKEEAKEARENQSGDRGRRSGTDIYGGAGVGQSSRRGGAVDQYGGRGGTVGGVTSSRSRGRSRDSLTSPGTGLPGDLGRTDSRRRGSSRRSSTTGDLADPLYGPGMEGLPGMTGTQRGPRRPAINDVYIKYDERALTRLTDFSKIREPLVFWAHDDTAEPGNTYRYRIRLGVFNPVAGTNKLDERDKSKAEQVILWSAFSDTTAPVEIMNAMYFFANNVREADKTVTVQVSKLTLGHWYSHDFPVKQGELVGESMEYIPPEPDPRKAGALAPGGVAGPGAAVLGAIGPGVTRGLGPGVSPGARMTPFGGSQNTSNIPEYIDYSTRAVMVDAVEVSDWLTGRTMRARQYYDMLYSFDGADIKHMPVGRANWPQELQTVYSTISRLEKEPQEPFKAFGSSGTMRRGGQFDDMGGYEDMMYEDMGYDDMGLY